MRLAVLFCPKQQSQLSFGRCQGIYNGNKPETAIYLYCSSCTFQDIPVIALQNWFPFLFLFVARIHEQVYFGQGISQTYEQIIWRHSRKNPYPSNNILHSRELFEKSGFIGSDYKILGRVWTGSRLWCAVTAAWFGNTISFARPHYILLSEINSDEAIMIGWTPWFNHNISAG